ncbi:hypothetical protein OKA05_21995 [Luteolibacter arcticus]|uniref:ABC transporter permease n=1 Tax=Luteolibacter arcticus TaxID=1581411 RepID=A0ABT3GP47_9BACT|nr:hypothetical protein [Luteolibacter arcticus]MCW1925248.1 hypothetical protein [Luteolibacter arcticus]
MTHRPSWEKPLRQKLRQWRKRRFTPRWIMDQGGTIFVLFCLQVVLARGGENVLGSGGGGTGIGAVSGLVGALLAMSLRSRWQSHGWLLEWTPATAATIRRIRTREHLPAMVVTVLVTLLLSCLAAGLSSQSTVAAALGAAALSMGSGFALNGGRISTTLLYIGIVVVFFYAMLGGWLGFGESEFSLRMAKVTGLVWLPVLPWSFATHGTPTPALHLGILAVVLVISLREWSGAWRHREEIAESGEIVAPADLTAPEAHDEVSSVDQIPEAADEDQRRDIRQHVAFAWFGMEGFLPGGPMPRFERLLWRWFTPRQRFLSCLGSQQAMTWFPRTRWTIGTLVLMVLLALLTPWMDDQFGIDEHFVWLLVGFLALAAVAILTGWPGRDSYFQSWLELMHTPDLGVFPAFAVLPVTASEWIRAVTKEWIIRSVWISSLWSVAIVLGRKGLAPDVTPSWLLAFIAVPWLILAAWFPLSVMHRLVYAVSGRAFASNGITRVLPALVSGVMGLVAGATVFIGIGAGNLLLTSVALASGGMLGAFSLWQTLRRCRGMRLDLKPKPVA